MTRAAANRTARGADLVTRPVVFAPLLMGLAIAVSAWFAGRGLPVNDEGAVLTLAARILRGGVFFRDLDAYYFPGAAYLLAGWMRLVGEDLNAARWLAACVFSCLVLGLYLIAVQLLDRRRAAIFGIGLLSFKFLASPAFTAYMYGDLSLCFATYAIVLLVRHPYRGASVGLVATGVLVACATAAKQNVGIYLTGTIALLLAFAPRLLGASDSGFRRRLPELGAFGIGLLLAAAPMLGYFAAKGLLPDLIVSGILRPFLQYLPTSGISFTEPLAWWNLGDLKGMSGFPFFVGPFWSMLMNGQLPCEALYPVFWTAGEIFSRALYTSIPVAFIAVFWRWGRAIRDRSFTTRKRRVFAFAFAALAVVLSAFPRADLFHVMSVYPVLLLLLFALRRPAGGESGDLESDTRAPWISACAVALLLFATGSLAIAHQGLKTYRMQIARADLYIEPSKSWVESVVEYVESTLGPGEPLFVYGHEAYYYFFTGHYTEWPFVQLYPGQVGGERGMPLVRFLKRRPPSVIVRGLLEWPGVPGIPKYAPALNEFVKRNYEVYEDFFERHPPAAGAKPPAWSVAVLRRRDRV